MLQKSRPARNAICCIDQLHAETNKALGLLYAFEKSSDWAMLSFCCDDSHLHISAFK